MLSDEPLVVISAPAGYGKTTLLHQWAAVDERPFAWVGLSGSDNDPARLAEHLEQALLATGALCRRRLVLSTTLERAGTDVLWGVGSHPTEIAAVLPALSPVVIVLDDSQELTDPTATALLETTLDCLPQASRLVFAGRARPRLPLGHLQVQGRVLRMGPEDLSLAPEDGARLIEATGLRVNRRSEAKLLEVTEGWPAGLALAARSLRSGRDPDLDARNFDGSDVAVAEYLDEVLDQLDQASLDFLTETSVLERFSPGLCDAVRQRGGSAAIIKSLERWNVFLVPLDRAGQWYRYHKLFAGYLQARRRHTLGLDDAALHARASRWWEHEGDLDAAARHAYASGDLHRFEEIVWFAAPNFLASDRLPDLAAWLRLPTSEQVASSPPIALAAAWMRSVHDAAETGTLTANLAHTASSSLPDGTPVRAGLALLRATTAERGLSRAIADAASAYDAIENHSPWKAFACLFAGTALRLQGHRDHAEEALHEGYDRAALTMPALAAACLVQLAWVAMDEGEWEQARSYGARAQAFVESSGPGHEVTTFAAKVTGLFLSARQGDVKSGHRHLKDAIRQVPLGPSPGLAAIEARIVASQALVLLSDHAAAHRLLAEARLQTSRLREPGSLVEKIEQAQRAIDAAFAASPVADPLTPAEMRVLRYLPTYMSFEEIGRDLVVSRTTVKTQAIAVYRKLGVRSRAEAVRKARQQGLIIA